MAWNKPTTTEGTKFSFADIMKEQINDACVPSGLLPPSLAAHEGLSMPLENVEPPITGPQSSDDFALALVLQQMEDEEMMNATERRQQTNPSTTFEKIGVVSRYNTQTVFRHSAFPSKSNSNHVSSDYVEAKQKQAELTELGTCSPHCYSITIYPSLSFFSSFPSLSHCFLPNFIVIQGQI